MAERTALVRAEEAALARAVTVKVGGDGVPLRSHSDALIVRSFVAAFDPYGARLAQAFPRCIARRFVRLEDASGVTVVDVVFCPGAAHGVARFAGLDTRRLHASEGSWLEQLVASPEATRCLPTGDCVVSGQCTPVGDKCEATRDADCKRSTFCAAAGQCTLVAGACRPGSDADCRQSGQCTQFAMCNFAGGGCIIGSDQDCRRSAACAEAGACNLRDDSCVALGDADCMTTAACVKYGLCRAHDGACVASDAGCRQSERCKTARQCTAGPNTDRVDVEVGSSSLRPAIVCR